MAAAVRTGVSSGSAESRGERELPKGKGSPRVTPLCWGHTGPAQLSQAWEARPGSSPSQDPLLPITGSKKWRRLALRKVVAQEDVQAEAVCLGQSSPTQTQAPG